MKKSKNLIAIIPTDYGQVEVTEKTFNAYTKKQTIKKAKKKDMDLLVNDVCAIARFNFITGKDVPSKL